ncbi:anti-sigma factor [Bacillus salacetis]|uniref:anti-sigma factor n=1 Tax=Bacillus salacetis TaxID=2315464 RepID=UPI003BA12AA6
MKEQHCDRLLDYYNEHLSDTERKDFEKHLAECDECKESLQQLHELEDFLPYVSEPVEPPTELEERVFKNILGEEAEKEASLQPPARIRRRWIFPAAAALLAVSLLGNAYFITQLEGQKETAGIQESIHQVVKYAQLAAVEGNAKGTASIVKQGDETRLVVQASELENLSETEVYQVWLIKDEKPERAGTFTIEDGNGSVIFNLNEEYENVDWDMVAVSQEPDANSQLPQGNIVLASEL